MSVNKRLFYAIKQVAIKPDADSGNYVAGDVVYGAQDVSVSTNFNLTQIFELGQLEIYQSIEALPDVEITINKIFDGKPLIWHLATRDAASPSLGGRSNSRCIVGLGLFPDTNDYATGTPNSIMESSGLYPRSISYTFNADGGAFTESVSFVGNDKIFSTDDSIDTDSVAYDRKTALTGSGYFSGLFTGSDTPSGIEKSEYIQFDTTETALDINGMIADSDCTILPPDIDGITSSGTNNLNAERHAIIQSISISTDLGRESLNELGRRGPYHRYATFPTEVTCAIECLSQQGDNVSAVEAGIFSTGGSACSTNASNLSDSTIRIATCGGVRIYLGTKNRLSSVDFGGGTTDGGNDTNTYNFTNYNVMTVMSEYDPHPSGSTWWTGRDAYLLNT